MLIWLFRLTKSRRKESDFGQRVRDTYTSEENERLQVSGVTSQTAGFRRERQR